MRDVQQQHAASVVSSIFGMSKACPISTEADLRCVFVKLTSNMSAVCW